MDILTAIKIRNLDGTYSDPIPISALAENIVYDKDHTLLDAIGTIDIDELGSLQDQILELKQRGIDAATANANQVPVADGQGGWSWQDKTNTSNQVTNLSNVGGVNITQALNSLNDLAQSNQEKILNMNSTAVNNNSSVEGKTVSAALDVLSNKINNIDTMKAISVSLSKSSYTINVKQNSDIDYSDCFTDIQVLQGSTDVTDLCTFSFTPSYGVYGVWIASSHRYKITELMDVTKGHVVFNISYKGVTLTRTFSIVLVYDGESTIHTEIESSAGNIFRGNNITTTLTCRVYQGTEEITNKVSSFRWEKYNADGTLDEKWSRPLAGNVINITNADVYDRAVFKCEVTI